MDLSVLNNAVQEWSTTDFVNDENWDISMVAEYADEIFEYMKELETRMLPNRRYIDKQKDLPRWWRTAILEWMIKVHTRFSMAPETLFLSVNYLERFLSIEVIPHMNLQLTGAVAILIAAKYENTKHISIQNIFNVTSGNYSHDTIVASERFMLSVLQFDLGWPGPMSFLRRISKADYYDQEVRTRAKYFLEITVVDENFIGIPPSILAASAYFLAHRMLKKVDMTSAHSHYSGYTWDQVMPLIAMLVECCEHPTIHHSEVYRKYATQRFNYASKLVKNELETWRMPHKTIPS